MIEETAKATEKIYQFICQQIDKDHRVNLLTPMVLGDGLFPDLVKKIRTSRVSHLMDGLSDSPEHPEFTFRKYIAKRQVPQLTGQVFVGIQVKNVMVAEVLNYEERRFLAHCRDYHTYFLDPDTLRIETFINIRLGKTMEYLEGKQC